MLLPLLGLTGLPREASGTPMSEAQLNDLMKRHGDQMMRIAYSYLKDYGRAEDICQEVFIKLFNLNKTFDDAEHERAFILRITINLCKDHYKSFWHKRIVLGEKKEVVSDEDPGMLVAQSDEARRLFSLVSELDDAFKSVVILFYYEGLGSKEIAQVLSVPEATVRSRLKRAREKLQKKLKEVEAREK